MPSDFQSSWPLVPSGREVERAADVDGVAQDRAAATGVNILDQDGAGRGAVGLPELVPLVPS